MSAITDLQVLLPTLKTQLEQKASRDAGARSTFAATLASARSQDGASSASLPTVDTTKKDLDTVLLTSVLEKVLAALEELQASSFSFQAVAKPATLTSAGSPGQYCIDASVFYLCVASNQWVKLSMLA